MKYLTTLLFALAFFIPVAHAQEADTSAEVVVEAEAEVEAPTLLPGNPLYFLKSFKERTQMFFTFSKEKKAERAAEFAEVRQKEYVALTAEGKAELAEKVKARHEVQLEKLEARIEAIREENPDAAAKIEERIEVRREMFEKRLENASSTPKERLEQRTQMLQERLENAPEAARPGLERALQAPLNEGEARMRVRSTGSAEFNVRSAPEAGSRPAARQ